MKRVLSILLCLMLCIPAAAAFAEESSAVAQGFGGEVRVTVSIQNGKIISVTATGENETPGVGSRAIEQLPKMILAAQSADIDALSGCTVSSNAVEVGGFHVACVVTAHHLSCVVVCHNVDDIQRELLRRPLLV